MCGALVALVVSVDEPAALEVEGDLGQGHWQATVLSSQRMFARVHTGLFAKKMGGLEKLEKLKRKKTKNKK